MAEGKATYIFLWDPPLIIIITWPLGLGVAKHGSVRVEDVGGPVVAGLEGSVLDFSSSIGGGLGDPLRTVKGNADGFKVPMISPYQ